MNRTLSNVLLFAAGVAVGSLVTWKIVKSRYEFVEEEDMICFEDELEDTDEEEDPNEETEEDRENEEYERYLKETKDTWYKKPPLKEYAARVKQLSYADVDLDVIDDEEDDEVYEPYVIPPEEFGSNPLYETYSLNYYADGVLTDDLDNRIEDVESMVCVDFADHFGEYEDDSVFVRNEQTQCDYEILRDNRNFADVVGEEPYPSEDE